MTQQILELGRSKSQQDSQNGLKGTNFKIFSNEKNS